MASIDRTAYPRFKRVVSVRELAEAFMPVADEVEWARSRSQGESNFLALVVLLKCYQRLGYFPKLADVPVVVINHVRAALGLAEDVAAVHESDRTLWRHRDYVRDRLNVVYKPAEARAIAEKAIRKAVTTKDNPADLINVALEELVRARRELPGFTTLDKMVSAIRTETNTQLFALVATRLDAADRRRLARLLWLDPTSRRSEFDRLKTPAKAASLGKFKLRLAHLQALDELGATERWLDGIPATKIAHFAGEARVTDVGDMRDIGEAKRWTLLASLIHECRTSARDEVATMFCKRMAVIHKRGKERLVELHEQHRAESERLLDVFGDVLAGAREATAPVDGTVATATAAAVAERAGRLLLKTGRRGRDRAALGRPRGGGGAPRQQLPAASGEVLQEPPLGAVHPARHPRSGGHQRGSQRAGRGGVPARDPGPHQRVRPGEGHRWPRGGRGDGGDRH